MSPWIVYKICFIAQPLKLWVIPLHQIIKEVLSGEKSGNGKSFLNAR